ncbi:hypothetical protein SK128_014291, partial [Halocaridina rubra]
MELAEEVQHLTTLINLHERFKHCGGPMGFVATGDIFCLRGAMALQDITSATQPLRLLMSPKKTFTWTMDHDEAFHWVKTALFRLPVLASFDPTLPGVLQTDASHLY